MGCDRSGTPNPHKNIFKTAIQRKLDCPFEFYTRKYAMSTTWTLQLKNTEHSHDSTENIMANLAFRKFNEKETSQTAQMSESLLIRKKIWAQLCNQGDSHRQVILQDIYRKVKKIKKYKLQVRRPIDALIENLKEENILLFSARDTEEHNICLFSLTLFP
ncbi:hypothetical protein O181_008935 [Austropuccinia psidii MF-1]|uniref:FAR1 domain-containing protein n=1 Tax=Austropuccinia psidii MF-1 TaxID=1389203 RepID=A0A9Q3BQB8_9BASI|nr:hypothetical protein [Austropuccinia psidii MF-1]